MNKLSLAAPIGIFLFLGGCANLGSPSPYVEGKFTYQINSWSDWVLQPERPWICGDKPGCENEHRLHLEVGLEWKKRVDCPYFESMLVGEYSWGGIGCSIAFGKKFGESPWGGYLEPAIVHQLDSHTSDFLQTDQNQWQSHNPYIHLRGGVEGGGFYFGLATGRSIFQGAPFESEENNPDIYWTNIELGVRFWGKTGAFQPYWDQWDKHYERSK